MDNLSLELVLIWKAWYTRRRVEAITNDNEVERLLKLIAVLRVRAKKRPAVFILAAPHLVDTTVKLNFF